MDLGGVKYKNKCCVPGCQNHASKRHRFPKNNPELLQKWIENVKVPKLRELTPSQIYISYFVCDKHFAEEYLVPGTHRGLRRDAIPTLCLPVPPEEEHTARDSAGESATRLDDPQPGTSKSVEGDLCRHVETSETPQGCSEFCPPTLLDEPQPDTSKSGQSDLSQHVETCEISLGASELCPPKLWEKKHRGILQAVNVTRQADLTPKCKKIYTKLCDWGRKTARAQHRIKNLQTRLAHAQKVANCPNFSNLLEKVNEATYTFIMQQVRTQNLPTRARRFTLNEKILALTLLKASGRGYRLLSKIFALPSRRTLTNMLNHLPYKAGINRQIFNALKMAVSQFADPRDKLCAVVFDEMAISPSLSYDRKHDCIQGVEDFGDKRTPHIADHANVFIIKGICRQWKQAVSFTFSKGPTKAVELKKLIKEMITECQNIGLEVVATICDQGSSNQSAVNSLLKDTEEACTRSGVENQYLGFLINGKEVLPLYDVPHLFKGIRNNLLTKNLQFVVDGTTKVAKWDHIKKLYLLDTMDDTRLCPNITDAHIFPGKMNKMKVSTMAQVFSHKVGSLMKRISLWNIQSEYSLEKEADDTAELILFIDKLFDSLNANNKTASAAKSLRGAVTQNSQHEEFWRRAITILSTMKFFDTKRRTFIKVPSTQNLIKTLKSFIYLKNVLLKKMNYILTRALNQDCLENFFGNLRGHGARNISPDVSHFITSFKALLVNNYMSSHSPGANCERDFTEGSLDSLRCFLTGEDIAGIHPVEEDNVLGTDNVPVTVLSRKKSRVAKSTIAYVAGYIGKRASQASKHCENCKRILSHSDGDVDMEVIIGSEYQGSSLCRPGSYLYFTVTQSLSRLFYLVPRYCHRFHFSSLLRNSIKEHINFDILNCREHPQSGDFIAKLIITCILYFWCKRVNRILMGKDEKFVRFLRTKPLFVDPIKVEARNRFLTKLKYKKK